jgi:hypothetical protein
LLNPLAVLDAKVESFQTWAALLLKGLARTVQPSSSEPHARRR